ncbi:hypothetical protein GCM10010413_31260 [Promicromonospora sukumoe]|uniref:F0F1-type ATP synthase membrane subunit b/b n=1 Tax=Promicromonospora sukumoe TaxID=88382 RepID=A0A7W3J839_9MICO|nr:hypothetical protein [Promicromonospora sukumoe]MBA8807879.1 F0F1-type ATP synthase membrane subunit b/b' [Promicromonospora sukumoe]
MSAARVGEWQLLDYDDDPVPAEPSGLDAVIRHYKKIAETMTTQAALLKRIGDGDETLLKGEAAGAMRKRAQESHEALGKAADRYEDVHAALVEYQPALETARSKTGEALDDAEKAARALATAEDMSDPVNEDRGEDAEPLTDTEKQASEDRATAISGAKGTIEAAKTVARNAMTALDVAAEAAATKIKENWGDDGLNHSWQDALRARFMKFLKGLVEVLGWIGMALAVLAMIIPGLNALAWVAFGVAVAGLIGSIVLAATGEESWMGVIWGVIGVLTAGIGLRVASKISNAVKASRAASQSAVTVRLDDLGRLAERMAVFRNNIDGPFSAFALNRVLSGGLRISENLTSLSRLQTLLRINPNAWRIPSFTGAIGIGGIKQLNALNAALDGLKITGITGGFVKPWVYVLGSASWLTGLVTGAWSTAVPASSFGDDGREGYDGTTDWELNHITKDAGEPI